MVCFKYSLNQDCVELQASNWSGIERVFVNGQMVSRKLNFGRRSEHSIPLQDGNNAKCQLLIDPFTEEMMCRIYKSGQLIASLKQGKENLAQIQALMWQSLLGGTLLAVLLVAFMG